MFWIALLVVGGAAYNAADSIIGSMGETWIGILSILCTWIFIDAFGIGILANSQTFASHAKLLFEAQLPFTAVLLACYITAMLMTDEMFGDKMVAICVVGVPAVVFALLGTVISAIFVNVYADGSPNIAVPAFYNSLGIAIDGDGYPVGSLHTGMYQSGKSLYSTYYHLAYGGTAGVMIIVAIVIGAGVTVISKRLLKRF